MDAAMEKIFVLQRRPLRVHFDEKFLPTIAAKQLGRRVEQAGGVLVNHPSSSDVLVVDPAEPWVFHDYLKNRRPEIRPFVVLAFWIPLCLVTRSLVWANSAHWSNVYIPFERPAFPETPQGILAYGSFLAGLAYSKIVPPGEPKSSPRASHEPETLVSNVANSDREVSRELEPGSESEDEGLGRRAREGSALGSTHADTVPLTAFKPSEEPRGADEAEAAPSGDAFMPSEDIDMIPRAPSPGPAREPSAEPAVALRDTLPASRQRSPSVREDGSTRVPSRQATAPPERVPTPVVVEPAPAAPPALAQPATSASPAPQSDASQYLVKDPPAVVSETRVPSREPEASSEPQVPADAITEPATAPPAPLEPPEPDKAPASVPLTGSNSPAASSVTNAPASSSTPLSTAPSQVKHSKAATSPGLKSRLDSSPVTLSTSKKPATSSAIPSRSPETGLIPAISPPSIKVKIRPRMRPVPPDESEGLDSGSGSALGLRLGPEPRTKLNVVEVGGDEVGESPVKSKSRPRPSLVFKKLDGSSQSTTTTPTPSVTPSASQTTPGASIVRPKQLVIRSPTHSTIPIRPSPQKASGKSSLGVGVPPVPPTPTPEQVASTRPQWTREEDQYIMDYMNWVFAHNPLASTSEIMKEIASHCPYRSVSNWQKRFTAKEDSIYMHGVPVLFERLTNRTSHGGRSRGDANKAALEILSGTRTRSRRAVEYAGSSSEEVETDGEYEQPRKRARHEQTTRRRSDRI